MFSNLGLSKQRKHVAGSSKPQTTTSSTFATQAAVAMFNKPSVVDANEGHGMKRSDFLSLVPSMVLDNHEFRIQDHAQSQQHSEKAQHHVNKPILLSKSSKRNSDFGNYGMSASPNSPKIESKQPKYSKRHSSQDVSNKRPYLDHDLDTKNVSTPSVNGLHHTNPSSSTTNSLTSNSNTSASLTALMAAAAATKKLTSPLLVENSDRNLSSSSFFSQPPIVSNERTSYKHPESPSARSLYSNSSNIQYSPASGIASRSHSADRSRYNSTESLVSQHGIDPNDSYDFLKKTSMGSKKDSNSISLGKINYSNEAAKSIDGSHSNPLKLEMNFNSSPRKLITNLNFPQQTKKPNLKAYATHPPLSLSDEFTNFDVSLPADDSTPVQESFKDSHNKQLEKNAPMNEDDNLEFLENEDIDPQEDLPDHLPQYPLAFQDPIVHKKKLMRKHGKNVLKGLKTPSGKSHEIRYYPIGLEDAGKSQIPVVTNQRPVEFRKTMRKDKHKGFNEDKPWKHHNDAMVVTEIEKKRYDGVWVANKGLYMNTIPKFHIEIEKQKATSSKDSASSSSVTYDGPGVNYGVTSDNCNGVDIFPYSFGLQNSNTTFTQDLDHPSLMVHAFVVSNIWRRSKLSNITLSKIWNLVDTRREGYLTRDEFVIGMWLVDQCLYGRKLPNDLDATLWESVKKLVVQVVIKPKKNKLH